MRADIAVQSNVKTHFLGMSLASSSLLDECIETGSDNLGLIKSFIKEHIRIMSIFMLGVVTICWGELNFVKVCSQLKPLW